MNSEFWNIFQWNSNGFSDRNCSESDWEQFAGLAVVFVNIFKLAFMAAKLPPSRIFRKHLTFVRHGTKNETTVKFSNWTSACNWTT
jgi:hypothetical protein